MTTKEQSERNQERHLPEQRKQLKMRWKNWVREEKLVAFNCCVLRHGIIMARWVTLKLGALSHIGQTML